MEFGFYRGNTVMVTKAKNVLLCKVLESFAGNYKVGHEFAIINNENGNLEPLVSDVLSIGDSIRVINGTLTGTVTAFERSTNRAVCVSDKIGKYKDDRTRYAYKPHELEIHNKDLFVFTPGRWYKFNGDLELLAVQSVFKDDEVMLFNSDGYVCYSNVPKNASKKDMASKTLLSNPQLLKDN